MQKFTSGFAKLSEKNLIIDEVNINETSFNTLDLINSKIDISKTWLPISDTRIEVQYSLDLRSFNERIPQNPDDEFFLVLLASCRSTKREIVSEPLKLQSTGKISLTIPGFEFANSFRLSLECFVRFPESSSIRLSNSAWRNFSSLYQKEFTILLSGDESQISVFSADFSDKFHKDAFWDVVFNLPFDTELWPQLELEEVLSVLINSNLSEEIMREKTNLALLLTDIVYISFSKFFENDEAYELLTSDSAAGSWIVFVRNYFRLVFKDIDSPLQTWNLNKEIVLRNCQSISSQLLNRAHNRILEDLSK